MDEFDDLREYNGDPAHDMKVDFDRYMHTGEGAELFEDNILEDFGDDIDDWD